MVVLLLGCPHNLVINNIQVALGNMGTHAKRKKENKTNKQKNPEARDMDWGKKDYIKMKDQKDLYVFHILVMRFGSNI